MALPPAVIDWEKLREDVRASCANLEKGQASAAHDIGISPSIISRFLNGKTLSADHFMLVCWWMEVPSCEYSLLH